MLNNSCIWFLNAYPMSICDVHIYSVWLRRIMLKRCSRCRRISAQHFINVFVCASITFGRFRLKTLIKWITIWTESEREWEWENEHVDTVGKSIPTELTWNHLDYDSIHLLSTMQYINIILFAGFTVWAITCAILIWINCLDKHFQNNRRSHCND